MRQHDRIVGVFEGENPIADIVFPLHLSTGGFSQRKAKGLVCEDRTKMLRNLVHITFTHQVPGFAVFDDIRKTAVNMSDDRNGASGGLLGDNHS